MQTTSSRAAVLCLGGWGLQTMLHLWPRISALQEEQHFLGGGGEDPARIGRTSAFATILPHPLVGTDPGAYRPFTVLQPHPHNHPPPFFVEQELISVFKKLGEPAGSAGGSSQGTHLLYGERLGYELLERSDGHASGGQSSYPHTATPYVVQIPFELLGAKPTNPPVVTAQQRLDRRMMFTYGLAWSEVLARTLLRYVIEPTRLDALNPEQPFVQTSLYVVASLAEPLSSALIWPILAELKATLSASNLVKVTGVFATGSFAPDATRSIEEAASYAALCDLEALQGVAGRAPSTEHLKDVVRSLVGSKLNWQERVGTPLFDHIYLLDREKSNQSLARDSLELTVLAANAIETFLAVQGDTYVDQNLGYRSPASHKANYSLLGAASNYVPVDAYLRAALDEEKKRLARELVLAPTPQEEHVETSLAALRATPERVMRDLLEPRTIRIFSKIARPRGGRKGRRLPSLPWARRRPGAFSPEVEDDWLPDLRIRRAYIFPPSAEAQMREQFTAWRWRAVTETHAHVSIQALEQGLRTTYVENIWGLAYNTPEVSDDQVASTLEQYNTRTWAERRQDDVRTLPRAVYLALQQSVMDLCSGPGGLRLARVRVKAWLDETNRLLRARGLVDRAQIERWAEQDQDKYRTWQRSFVRAAGGGPHVAASVARALPAWLFFTFVVILWLKGQTPPPDPYLYLLVVVALVGGMTLSVLAPHAVWLFQMQLIKRRRIKLALERAEHIANKLLRETLLEFYTQLRDHLKALHGELDAAVDGLEKWAEPMESAPVPPADSITTHLRIPHTEERLWEQAKARLREHKAPEGDNNAAWFVISWQRLGADLRRWQTQGASMAQTLRLPLERVLNEFELTTVQNLEARRRVSTPGYGQPPGQPAQPPPTLEDALKQTQSEQDNNQWCGFAAGVPGAIPRPVCTACPNFQRLKCPFSSKGPDDLTIWSIDSYVKSVLDNVLKYLLPSGRVFPNDPELMRLLLSDYAIERLLFGSMASRVGPAARQGDATGRASLNRLRGMGIGIGVGMAARGGNGKNRSSGHAQVGAPVAGTDGPGTGVDHAKRSGPDSPATQDGVLDPTRFLELLLMRAKPAASHDDALSIASHLEAVNFGATKEGKLSILNDAASRFKVELLTSKNPLSITVICTINRLALENLTLAQQYMLENLRLESDQRRELFLVEDEGQIETLYGMQTGVVKYEKIVF